MCRQVGQLKRKADYSVSRSEEETQAKLARMEIDTLEDE